MNIRSQFKPMFYDEQGHFQATVSNDVIKVAQEHGLFKAFLPKDLKGKNWELSQTLKLFRDTAYCNGSFGWLIQIGNGGTYFACNNSDATNHHFFAPQDAVLTGSAMTGGVAKRGDKGYFVTGQWRFASGSAFATVFTATVICDDTNEVRTALVPRKYVTVLEDWDTLGMTATSSHSFKVENIFVPEDHFFKTSERINYLQHPIFNLPFFVYAQVFFLSTLQGLIERFVEEGLFVLNQKRTVWETYLPEKIQRIKVLETVGTDWLMSVEKMVEELLEQINNSEELAESQIQLRIKEDAQSIKEWAHQWFAILGMDVLSNSHIMNVFYRDILTITHHGLLQL